MLVISHKPCWRDDKHLVTTGGFPRHISALRLVDPALTLAVPISPTTSDQPSSPLDSDLDFVDLGEVPPSNWRYLGKWCRLMVRLLRLVRSSHHVHVLGPSSVSLLAILAAWATLTPMSSRYCGVWGHGRSFAERTVQQLLAIHARFGGVVFATGVEPDVPVGNLRWIFSTSLWEHELVELAPDKDRELHTPVRLGCLQRLVSSKRTEIAIEAVQMLAATGLPITLVVMGDGPQRHELEALAQRRSASVEFTGQLRREAAVERLCTLDVLVFPSESEGFPKAVSEAQACGIAVVAATDSGLERIVNTAGVLADPTAESFARAIEQLIGDPERYRLASKAGIALAQRRSLETWAAIIADALGRPLATRSVT